AHPSAFSRSNPHHRLCSRRSVNKDDGRYRPFRMSLLFSRPNPRSCPDGDKLPLWAPRESKASAPLGATLDFPTAPLLSVVALGFPRTSGGCLIFHSRRRP